MVLRGYLYIIVLITGIIGGNCFDFTTKSPSLFSFPKFPSSSDNPSSLTQKIVSLASNTNYGAVSSNNQEIILIIDKLRSLKNNDISYVRKQKQQNLIGNWKLLWTTEKETLLFANKGLFGQKCESITQYLNVNEGVVNNSIEFEDRTSFCVDGKALLDENDPLRVNFKFSKAVLQYKGFKLPLPPIGQGWFETVYLDDKYRVSYDIRKDYSIFQR